VRAVTCAGAAGGLDPALKVGDVVVGVTTVEHDYTLRFIQRPLPCHQANADLVRELTQVSDRVADGGGTPRLTGGRRRRLSRACDR